MIAKVDRETCTGCELCTQTCPEVFMMEDNVAVAFVDKIPAGTEETCRQAAQECPVEAITITE